MSNWPPDGVHKVFNEYGAWLATRGVASEDGPLVACLPTLGDSGRLTWMGSPALTDPADVLESYRGAIGFRSHDEAGSLRRPQIGALHSIVGVPCFGGE